MDVDLSTDLAALLPLVAPLLSGHSDLAIGTRLARGARVVRGPKRELISRGYNLLLRGVLRRRVLRRPVRVQGDPRRRGPAAAAAGRGRRVVLRHRAARAGRARRAARPRGARRLGRRPRLAGSTSSRPSSTTCAASPCPYAHPWGRRRRRPRPPPEEAPRRPEGSPMTAGTLASPPCPSPPTRPTRRCRAPEPGAGDGRWVRPALLLLLGRTAVLYLWDLGASGWANSFYSAAVQAGTKSWKAFFFGSSDAANFITVDKPPAVAVGDGAVGARLRRQLVEHPGAAGARGRRRGRPAVRDGPAVVRRRRPALLAGAVLALTPVAALMFRFNNPDALLVLLLVARGVRDDPRRSRPAGTRWLVARRRAGRLRLPDQDAAGVPRRARRSRSSTSSPRRRRCGAGSASCSLAGVALLVAGRLVGRDRRAVPGGRPSVHRRLAEQQRLEPDLRLQRLRPADRQRDRQRRRRRRRHGGHVGRDRADPAVQRRASAARSPGCCPAALIAARRAACGSPRRAPRTDRTRAALLLWGGWLLVTGAAFSFVAGHHPPVLHGRARAGDRRARRHRRAHALARGARRRRGARSRWPRVLADRGLGVRAARPHADLAALAALRRAGRSALGRGRSRSLGVAPCCRGRRRRGGRRGRARRRARRPGGVRAAHRRDRRTPARSRRPARRQPAAGRRSGRRARRRRLRRRRPPGGSAATGAQAGTRRHRPAAGARRGRGRHGGGGGGIGGLLNGSTPSAALTALLKADAASLHLGRRHRRRQQRRRLPAGHAASRSWRSAASTAPTRRRRSRSSSTTSPTGKIHYFIAAAASAAAAARAAAAQHVAARSRSWVEPNFTAHDGRRRHGLRPDERRHDRDAEGTVRARPRQATADGRRDRGTRDAGGSRYGRRRGGRRAGRERRPLDRHDEHLDVEHACGFDRCHAFGGCDGQRRPRRRRRRRRLRLPRCRRLLRSLLPLGLDTIFSGLQRATGRLLSVGGLVGCSGIPLLPHLCACLAVSWSFEAAAQRPHKSVGSASGGRGRARGRRGWRRPGW